MGSENNQKKLYDQLPFLYAVNELKYYFFRLNFTQDQQFRFCIHHRHKFLFFFSTATVSFSSSSISIIENFRYPPSDVQLSLSEDSRQLRLQRALKARRDNDKNTNCDFLNYVFVILQCSEMKMIRASGVFNFREMIANVNSNKELEEFAPSRSLSNTCRSECDVAGSATIASF